MIAKLSNLDKTRRCAVRKGCTVVYGSRLGYVDRVRLGRAYVRLVGAFAYSAEFLCSELEVRPVP